MVARPRRARRVAVVLTASLVAVPIVSVALILGADWIDGVPTDGPNLTILHEDYPWEKQLSKPAFVLARGAQTSSLIFGQHERLFAGYGDTKSIDYNPIRFDKTAVIDGIVSSVPKDATEIVFVGVSMGGLVVYDAAQKMRSQGDERPIKFIFVDSPTGKDDLYQGSAASFVASLPLGERSNQLSSLVWRFGFTPSDPSQIHPRDIAQLEALWKVMRNYPLSGVKGEYGYITTHPRLTAVSNSKAVFIQSTNDRIVRPRAYNSLSRLFPNLLLIPVDCTHASLLDEPGRYDRAFRQALRHLGVA